MLSSEAGGFLSVLACETTSSYRKEEYFPWPPSTGQGDWRESTLPLAVCWREGCSPGHRLPASPSQVGNTERRAAL